MDTDLHQIVYLHTVAELLKRPIWHGHLVAELNEKTSLVDELLKGRFVICL